MKSVFSVDKSGNYKVYVKFTADKDREEVTVFLNRRRLVDIFDIKKDEVIEKEYLVNICQMIPCEFDDPNEYQDMIKLEIVIADDYVKLLDLRYEEWKGKTIYIAGDSTVTDQSMALPYKAEDTYAGWGQMLSYYVKDDYAVCNHAHSGLSSESFREEGHYKCITDNIKKGDICIFQFGHNDQKIWYLMAEDGYRKNLVRYIEEIRSLGANPVLATSLARNTWNKDGTYNDLLKDYTDEVLRIGIEMKIPVLDLHGKSVDFIIASGRITTSLYLHPGDCTHSNDYGAYKFAGYIYDEMKKYPDFVTREFDYYKYEPELLPDVKNTKDYEKSEAADSKEKEEKIIAGDIAQNGLSQTESIELAIKEAKKEYCNKRQNL